MDQGLWRPASLGDYVWEDLNHNGQQDDGNTGINGVPVALLNSSNNVVSTTTTFTGGPGNIPGYYTFTNLISGTYHVSFTLPSGYVATTPNVGNDATDSDGLPSGNAAVTGNYVLNAGQSIPTVDQGLWRPTWTLRCARIGGGPVAVVQAGDDVTYTIEVFNQGTLDASQRGGRGLHSGWDEPESAGERLDGRRCDGDKDDCEPASRGARR